jgi:hypothetical protein
LECGDSSPLSDSLAVAHKPAADRLCGPGCGENYGAPASVPVKGRITIKGEPLEGGAEVAFVPKDQGGDRRPGIGRVNDDGTYVLTSHSVFGDGVEPGDYKVIVYPVAPESQDTEKKDAGIVESPIPEKYRKPESTTLETSVDEEDKGADFDFDLE